MRRCGFYGLVALAYMLPNDAMADWPFRILKVECTAKEIRIIDYSAYNEDGKRRLREKGVIDVDKLSTWKHTNDDLNVPDKPQPYKRTCKLQTGRYAITLTNQSTGGYSPPDPVINITRITSDHKSERLFKDLELTEMPNKETEIVISGKYPTGQLIKE